MTTVTTNNRTLIRGDTLHHTGYAITPDLIGVFAGAELHASTLAPKPRASVDEFLDWLASEDFGDDPERIRRDAWGI